MRADTHGHAILLNGFLLSILLCNARARTYWLHQSSSIIITTRFIDFEWPYTRVRASIHARTHTHTHTHSHISQHALHILSLLHKCTHASTHTDYARTHTHTFFKRLTIYATYKRTHARTHTHELTRMRTHTHTYHQHTRTWSWINARIKCIRTRARYLIASSISPFHSLF